VVGSCTPPSPPDLAQAASPRPALAPPTPVPGKARWFVPPPPALALGSARAPPPSPPQRRARGALLTQRHVDLLQAVAAAVPGPRCSRGARKRRHSPEPAHGYRHDHRRLPSAPRPACCAHAQGAAAHAPQHSPAQALASRAYAVTRAGSGAPPPVGREEQGQRGRGASRPCPPAPAATGVGPPLPGRRRPGHSGGRRREGCSGRAAPGTAGGLGEGEGRPGALGLEAEGGVASPGTPVRLAEISGLGRAQPARELRLQTSNCRVKQVPI